jgi:hypothetical protein
MHSLAVVGILRQLMQSLSSSLVDQRIFTLKVFDKWSDGSFSSEGCSVVTPGATASNSLSQMSSKTVVLSVGQLGERGHDAVVSDNSQVLFVSGDVGDCGTDRTRCGI